MRKLQLNQLPNPSRILKRRKLKASRLHEYQKVVFKHIPFLYILCYVRYGYARRYRNNNTSRWVRTYDRAVPYFRCHLVKRNIYSISLFRKPLIYVLHPSSYSEHSGVEPVTSVVRQNEENHPLLVDSCALN